MLFLGGKKLETTTEDETEIVNYFGENGTLRRAVSFRTLSFTPLTDCTVSVNRGPTVFIPANSTLKFERSDGLVESFIIHGRGIKYLYVATGREHI